MKILSSKYILLIIILFSFYGCNKKFESSKWISEENGLYGGNYRKQMLDDLINNVLTFPKTKSEKGTIKSKVVQLIGKSKIRDCEGNDIYEIEEKQGSIDPNGFVNLKLMYDVDSTLIGYIIEDGIYKE